LVVMAVVANGSAALGFYSKIVSFGDSLTDVGNAGRYSNGLIWVEQLADQLGVARATASNGGGANYAVGGSLTSDAVLQASAYVTSVSGHADPNALYTVWTGGNDFGSAVKSFKDPLSSLPTWTANVVEVVSTLYDAGGRNFLVLNLPPLGETPGVLAFGSAIQTLANTRTEQFNTQLSTRLAAFESQNLSAKVVELNIHELFEEIIANRTKYGLENVTQGASLVTGADASKYLFWDEIHPTATGHGLVAAAAMAALPVPEPNVLTMLVIMAVIGLSVRGRGHA
jgi:phospholipase/lecithinase/hemolysin